MGNLPILDETPECPTIGDDMDTVRQAHDFDCGDAPYQPEVLSVARAAERLADEVERLQARIAAAIELCDVVDTVNGVPHVADKFRAVLDPEGAQR